MAVEVHRQPKTFNCKTCVERYCDAEGELPGSLGPAPYELYEIKDNLTGDVILRTNVCLLPMVTPESRYWLRLHVHYRNNVLAVAGGLLNQPERYSRAMEIIERY